MRTQTQSVLEFLPGLLNDLEGAQECVLLEIETPPSMECRPGATVEVRALVAEAKAMQGPDDSFTETLMGVAARQGSSESVLKVAQFHQGLAEAPRCHRLPLPGLTSAVLEDLVSEVPPSRMLVLTSRLKTTRGSEHLPLVDFKLAAHKDNDSSILAAARCLGVGSVVVSGSSYHYYGSELMSSKELTEWLLRAQLLSRYVDTRWITHQLLEGQCALRISRGGATDSVPRVLRVEH